MAPKEIEEQTFEIIRYLFDDGNGAGFRDFGHFEPDGPDGSGGDGDSFDAVLVADKLKEVGDKLSKDAEFQKALNQLRQAVARQALADEFCNIMDNLCQTTMPQNASVAQEMQLIRASVALGVCIKNNAPELKDKICDAMATFLNTRVGAWVVQQGGWDAVADDA